MLPALLSVAIAAALVLASVAGLAAIVVSMRRSTQATARFADSLRSGAVARATPGPDGAFALRFPSPGRELGVWVDVELDGREEDGRDRAQVALVVRTGGLERFSETVRVGEDASSPLAGATAVDSRTRSVGMRTRFSALIRLAQVPVEAVGTRVEVQGSVTPATDVTLRRFEVLASPWPGER